MSHARLSSLLRLGTSAQSGERPGPPTQAAPALTGSTTESGTHPDSAPARTARRGALLAGFLFDGGIYAALAALICYFWVASPYFMTEKNVVSIGQAVAINGILAAGMTIALIAGQLDLTIGATLGITSVAVAGAIQNWHWSWPVAALFAIAVGLVIGCANTVLVVGLNINSIIATLAGSIAITGLALQLTNGQLVVLSHPGLTNAANAKVIGVPVSVIIMAAVYVAGYVLLTRTVVGYHLYAVGGNETAAVRAGIKVRRLYLSVFLITGALAAVAGVITAGQAGSGGPNYGNGAEFDVLTAVLLGGIGISGARGRIERTLAGVVLIGVLTNGQTLLDVDVYLQELIKGAVFVLAVVMSSLDERRRRR